ncbi:DNA replication and repair protein RecO [Alkalithermobacter thermoalcaliphilus JW-YL-7 = DSM 7308]|uniref:DNA repair protein RecO n=1 Tax=Alkalithermobacter thermoalcaliphilus JW-YL-7 = DSM 7308 TaxID=1121328 RepID=A0A150FQ07_CLOPD|nr:DNA repair protein recO [[Clostridium] paradoxum JW-YL-7 = DSM 7308]SHK64545.1 DNA replication and repair protein RecO [[Clostridium] paradoxum JW-YL-7 = DSM 7308]
MITLIETEGIVLKSTKFKESDAILTIFTRKLGKISAIAKGAKRPKSSMLSSTQVFSYSNFSLHKSTSMYKISQTYIKYSFYSLSKELLILSYASYICELVDKVTLENQTNNRLFDLLLKTLYLYSKQKYDIEYLTLVFEIKLLDYIGYRPEVSKCAYCGNNNLISATFSISEGGAICTECQNLGIKSIKLDKQNLKLMEYILSNDIIINSRAKVAKYRIKELRNIIQNYLNEHVDNFNLKSLNFLKSISD